MFSVKELFKIVFDVANSKPQATPVAQDSSQSIVVNGFYDLTRLSKHEESVIKEVLSNASGKYSGRMKGLGLYLESYPIVYKPRYILFEVIVQRYMNSNNPMDILAVAFAYKEKGAAHYKDAIEYFEKFMSCANAIEKAMIASFSVQTSEPFFSYEIAKLYEKTYDFDNALKYAEIAEAHNKENAIAFPKLIGDILVKTDLDGAIRYYEKLLRMKKYRPYSSSMESKLDDLRKKKERGYKYKPRPYKITQRDIDFDLQVKAIAQKFV